MEEQESIENNRSNVNTWTLNVITPLKKINWLLLGIIVLGILLRAQYGQGGVMAVGARMGLEAYNLIQGYYDPNLISFHVGVRYVHLAIVGLLFFLFGVSEEVLLAQPFITSLLSILLIYYLGKKMFSREVGFLAAFLLAIYPSDIINATILESDGIMALFIGVGMYLYYLALSKNRLRVWLFCLSSGIFVGLAVFTKIFAVLIFPIPFLCEMIFARKEKKYEEGAKRYFYFLVGFLLAVSPFVLYQYVQTGDPLYNAHVEAKVLYAITQFKDWPVQYDVELPKQGDLLGFPKMMFNFIPEGSWISRFAQGETMFNLFFIILIAALCYYSFRSKKETIFLSMWILLPFLFLEFYWFIGKLERYLTIIAIPTILMISAFICELYERKGTGGAGSVKRKQAIFGVVLLLLLAVSIFQLGNPFKEQKILDGQRMESTEEGVYLLLKELPEKDVYVTSYHQVPILGFYFEYTKNYSGPMGYRGHTNTSFYDLHFVKDLSEIEDAYVVIHQFYVTGAQPDTYGYYNLTNGSVDYLLTPQLQSTWIPIAIVPDNLEMYYAPPQEK